MHRTNRLRQCFPPMLTFPTRTHLFTAGVIPLKTIPALGANNDRHDSSACNGSIIQSLTLTPL